MQPTYMPWIGYFSMIDKVDTFVFLDDVQLVQRSWQVRNKIKSNDKELMLTIPLMKDRSREDMFINNTSYNRQENWKEKHLKAIKHSYAKARYFDEVYSFIQGLYASEQPSVAHFNMNIIINICNKLGITTNIMTSSDLDKKEGKKDVLLANICEALHADCYLSAQGSAEYIEAKSPGGEFARRNIELYYHMYHHPTYTQLGQTFIPYIGIFDILFNEGFQHSLEIIKSGNMPDLHYLDYRRKYIEEIKI